MGTPPRIAASAAVVLRGNPDSVEQDGSAASCTKTGQARYHAWYAMYPHAQISAALTIHPGNSITASVFYNRARARFTLALVNASRPDRLYAVAHQIGALPPVSSLFAAVLGVNPVQHVLAARGVLATLPAASQRVLTGRAFFPDLISEPFHHGLLVAFSVAAALSAVAAVASLLRGGRPGGE
jgi:hypothetical protein